MFKNRPLCAGTARLARSRPSVLTQLDGIYWSMMLHQLWACLQSESDPVSQVRLGPSAGADAATWTPSQPGFRVSHRQHFSMCPRPSSLSP